jgi:membrane-bound lytic murein transglycosylase MltF
MNPGKLGLLVALLLLGCSSEDAVPAAEETSANDAATENKPIAPGDEQNIDYPTAGEMLPEVLEAVWEPWVGNYEGMVERRIIRVAVPYGGYQFYYDNGRPRGAIYELVQRFETYVNKELSRRNVRVYVVTIPLSRDQLIPAVMNGNADIVAGDLTITDVRELMVDFSAPLITGVNEVVVSGSQAKPMSDIDDLSGAEIFVRRTSSYYEHLQNLAVSFQDKGLPAPIIQPADELLEAEDIMEMLDNGLASLTIMDDYKAEFWTSVFPNTMIHRAMVVSNDRNLAWAVRKDSPELLAVVNSFLRKYGARTLIGNDTFNRYLADSSRVRCAGTAPIRSDRITELVSHFQKNGEQYNFDWLKLAAQGLQESGLRQNRKSPAGAVGIMQIKPTTAADRHIGIDDISTIENNIHAGTKYLRFIADRYYSGDGFDELNTWLLSLAAYNAGPAKINRYRTEAAKQGYDSKMWFDNVEIIAAKHIGRETVVYVSNIFKYYIGYQLSASRIAMQGDRFDKVLTGCSASE